MENSVPNIKKVEMVEKATSPRGWRINTMLITRGIIAALNNSGETSGKAAVMLVEQKSKYTLQIPSCVKHTNSSITFPQLSPSANAPTCSKLIVCFFAVRGPNVDTIACLDHTSSSMPYIQAGANKHKMTKDGIKPPSLKINGIDRQPGPTLPFTLWIYACHSCNSFTCGLSSAPARLGSLCIEVSLLSFKAVCSLLLANRYRRGGTDGTALSLECGILATPADLAR
mmetsp:Transcript_42592/g.71099  ORF Transcript_42592/g.71099 Transcript_42592/m.71099 type:complete len:227 (-) Transcript_42592:592-1272(-)